MEANFPAGAPAPARARARARAGADVDAGSAAAVGTHVRVFFDPSCPFAWIASQWMLKVEKHLPLNLSFGLMSISVLNEGRELDPWYREFNDRAWGPARVHTAVAAARGDHVLRDLYLAFGHLRHVERTDPETALVHALDKTGLPPELAHAATDTAYDELLRSSHATAVAPLGGEAGTPTLHIDGQGVFGPVLTSVPRGRQAVELFGAVRTLVACPAWSELKRPRASRLELR